MLNLSEILSNRKEVVFSFGEDTITIVYKPYALKGANLKKFTRLSRRADMREPEKITARLLWKIKHYPRKKLFKEFLKTFIIEWDFTDGDKQLSVDEGLKVLPEWLIERLYWSLADEIISATKQTISTKIKKK